MRLREPSVLMATGIFETTPLMVGFSKSSALPPPGDFISRSAHAVISSSVATGTATRVSSPARSSADAKSEKLRKAMCHHYAWQWRLGERVCVGTLDYGGKSSSARPSIDEYRLRKGRVAMVLLPVAWSDAHCTCCRRRCRCHRSPRRSARCNPSLSGIPPPGRRSRRCLPRRGGPW